MRAFRRRSIWAERAERLLHAIDALPTAEEDARRDTDMRANLLAIYRARMEGLSAHPPAGLKPWPEENG